MPPGYIKYGLMGLFLFSISAWALAEESGYYYTSYQITDAHRYDYGKMGGHWGHHLGHMVRTATQGLWYVDDTGTNVNSNPAIRYYRFDGNSWIFVKSLNNPNTIQQNTTSIAIGDTIYTYGLNINGGYIEEAIFDAVNRIALPYKRLFSTGGGGSNYIGAAVSPGGIRVVWWTRVVDRNGPSPWLYRYYDGTAWRGPFQSMVPGNDFSYVLASFVNETEFYVAGEVPLGTSPNWTYKMGVGRVILGKPLENFTTMDGHITAHDIWINSNSGDVHLFGQSISGQVSYYFKPAGGDWPRSAPFMPIGAVGRFRIIENDAGTLYLVFSQSGFNMMVMDKAQLAGRMDFTNVPVTPLSRDQGFSVGGSIWAECRTFQTTPVTNLNFATHGNDWDYSHLLRHVWVQPNDGHVKLNISLPNGQETLPGGKMQQLSWYADPCARIDSVKLEWSANGGKDWTRVTGSTPNTGTFRWLVPEVNSTNCLIRITSSKDSAISDQSDAPFAIEWEDIIKSLPLATIHSPGNDTTITVGSSIRAQGTGTDADGYIVRYQWETGDGYVTSGIAKTLIDYTYHSAGVYYLILTVKDNDEQWSVPDSIKITVIDPTSVNESEKISPSFYLSANYPNPFNSSTRIDYQLDRESIVYVAIFNIQGELVHVMVNNQHQIAGSYHLHWNGQNMTGRSAPTGCYFCYFKTDRHTDIRKLYLLR